MPVGANRYIDISTNKEINALSIQLVADEAGKEDTNKLTGKETEIANKINNIYFDNASEEEKKVLTEEAPEYKHKKTPLSTVKKTQKAKPTKKPK